MKDTAWVRAAWVRGSPFYADPRRVGKAGRALTATGGMSACCGFRIAR